MPVGLISSIMVSIGIFQRAANDSFDKLSTCSLNLNADCPKIPKSAFNFDESFFQTFLLDKYRFDIFHQGGNRNSFTLCGLLDGNFVIFAPALDPW